MSFKQGSIVLVPFPFSDLTGKKVRPALIVSGSIFNKNEDVIICSLTSNLRKRPYSIDIDSKNTIGGKLLDKSQIRTDTITRIKKDLIIKSIDELNLKTFKEVLISINKIFR